MTNNKPKNELRGFYSAYSAWINGGAQTGSIFRRTHGLCVSAYDYFSAIGVDVESPLEAMHEAFAAAGLKEKLPFNENPDHYREEQARIECHLNPARLAWVAAELQEYRNGGTAIYQVWDDGNWADYDEALWREVYNEHSANNFRIVYTVPQPLTDAERAELENYQHLRELYHAQEKRLFKLTQRIKGPAFDKYAHSPSQAIDVLESAIFDEAERKPAWAQEAQQDPILGNSSLHTSLLQQAAAPCRRNEMGFFEPCRCQQCSPAREMANDPRAGVMSLIPAERKPEAE